MRRTVLTMFALVAAGPATPRAFAAAATDPDVVEVVAPGLTLERSTGSTPAGPVRQALLRLAAGSTTRPVLLQADLSSPRTPTDLATAAGAVAAVNGDFFDIDRTGTPDGPVVRDGQVLKASGQAQGAVGFDGGPRWTGRLGQVQLQGSATVAGRTFPLAALGTRTVPEDALALFGPAWGAGDRALTVTSGVELEVRAGVVTAVRPPGGGAVPADGFVLVASGAVAAALAGTPLGSPATRDVQFRDDALAPGSTGFALGARLELVRDGAVALFDTADPTWAALRARTAVGWTADGDLLLLTVEGGTALSVGVTATETARRLVAAGAVGAVVLDGGGSAQLVARRPGDAAVSDVVVPSDGAPRPVANAVGLVPAPAGPLPAAVVLRPALGAAQVFPGLSLPLRVVPVTASGAPADGAPVLSSSDPGVLAVAGGAVRGVAPGRAAVLAGAGAATGRLDVEVLGPLTRLSVGTVLALPAAGSVLEVTVTGTDAAGRSAAVAAADVVAGVDPAVLRAEPLPDGRLRLTALTPGPVPTTLRLSAAGASADVPAAVGSRPVTLDPLDDPGAWTVATTRATASLSRVEGPSAGSGAVRLTYDFTGQPAGTTTAAVVAPVPVPLPAGSTAVALQVRGDGAGGWLRATLRVAGASRPVTFAARVDWTGWRRVAVPVPPDADVRLERVYLAQTSVAARRAGAVDLARLQAQVPPLPVVLPRRRRPVR
nr:phosphodiester glycosidase family protein [Kineococcus aurantiacus]